MTKSRLFQVVAFAVVVVFLVCGQQALAQESRNQLQFRIVPGMQANTVHPLTKAKEKIALEKLSSGFGVLPPLDGSGNDEWPCFGGGADCSSIATGGVVMGTPVYTQSLTACDASAAGAPNCGQIFWFYEDDTGDNTDDLVTSIVVKQGLNYILDTGTINHGINSAPKGAVVVFTLDTAFGTLGETGPGNGFCAGSFETCVNPKAGTAAVTITTTVGISTIQSKFSIFLQ